MDNSLQFASINEGSATVCLGHPSHTLNMGEILCQTCGALAKGAQIGIYRVQKFLGRGRSGQAYLAVHQRSGQAGVVKLTAPDAYNTLQWNLWEAVRREIRGLTALRHPAILPVFSCSTWQADLYQQSNVTPQDLLMMPINSNVYLLTLCQYIPGTLPYFVAHYRKREVQQALHARGKTLLSVLMELLQQLGSALTAAHQRGIAHGAIVPGNILLTGQDRLWLADFGIAKLHPPAAPYLAPELYGTSTAYAQGNLPAYWSNCTPQADQYMFAMLAQQIFTQMLQPGEYEPLMPVLQRSLQIRPERRYASLDLLLQDLVTVSGSPTSKMTSGTHLTHPSNSTTGSGLRNNTHASAVNNQGSSNYNHRSLSGTAAASITPAYPMTYVGNEALPATPPAVNAVPLASAGNTPATPAQPLKMEDWEKRGDKLFTQRDYEGALAAYHKAVEIMWGKASLWLALGDSYFALERYKEALMAYEQAMYLDPDDPQVWNNRGAALDALGRKQEAMDSYERAEQLA